MTSAPALAPLQAAESLRRSVQSLTVELLAVYEELALLYSVSGQIGRLADENQIAAVALKEAMEICEADCGWVALWDGDRFRVPDICRIGIQPQTTEPINQSVLESTLRQGKRSLVSHALAQEYGIAGLDAPSRLLASALKLDGHTRGYLCLGRRQGRAVFLSPDQKLISAIALLIAVEFENLRLQRSELDQQQLVRELQLARSIQQSLLPQDFSAVGFLEASGSSQPCFEIGGDFFDLLPINEGACALVIADVSGKGPPAALHASMVQGIVHAVFRTCPRLPLLMSTLNDCLLTHPAAGRFVTAFAATLSSQGRLSYSNAGHPPPLWVPREGNIVELGEGNPLLGIFPQMNFSEAPVQMAQGDLLVLYTDGVTETHDPEGNLFGSARLFEWAQQQRGRSPREVQDSLIQAVGEFCGSCRQNDDCSVLVVRYRGAAENR